jgi:hypothetical protein
MNDTLWLKILRVWAKIEPKWRDLMRCSPLLAFGLVASVIVFLLNPAKLGLMLWGCARLAVYAYIGYWIDRVLFKYARPHTLDGIAEGTAWKRRALIVSAAILAGALLP